MRLTGGVQIQDDAGGWVGDGVQRMNDRGERDGPHAAAPRTVLVTKRAWMHIYQSPSIGRSDGKASQIRARPRLVVLVLHVLVVHVLVVPVRLFGGGSNAPRTSAIRDSLLGRSSELHGRPSR